MNPVNNQLVLEISGFSLGIPVKVARVSQNPSSELHKSCKKCMGDIGYKKYCKKCDRTEPDLEIIRTYNAADDKKIKITEPIKEVINKKIGEQINVLGKISKDDIPLHLAKETYWVLPHEDEDKKTKVARTNYARLQRGLEKSEDVLVVNFCLTYRSRQKLGLLTSHDKFIIIVEIPYNEQIEIPSGKEFDTSKIKLKSKDVSTTKKLIEGLDTINYSKLKDPYAERLEEIITKPSKQIEKLKEVKEEENPFEKMLELQAKK